MSVEMTLRDVICFEGLLPGCSFPMETLSLQSFRQSLGDFYEAFVQNVSISRRRVGTLSVRGARRSGKRVITKPARRRRLCDGAASLYNTVVSI